MIISCPSCGTRYRHGAVPGGGPTTARCSSCQDVFPFPAGTRRYVLRASDTVAASTPAATVASGPVPATAGAAAPARTRMTFGMDDPSLAPRLDRTALDGAGGRPGPGLTYRIDARAASPADTPRSGRRPATAPPTRPAVTPVRRGGGLAYGLLLLVAAAGGPAGGWWLTLRLAEDPSTSLLGGIAAGLIVVGMALAWKRTDS